jgi:tRNA modification GTPase
MAGDAARMGSARVGPAREIERDTIVARSSAPGESTRALIRVSGPLAFALVDPHPSRRGVARAAIELRGRGSSLELPILSMAMPGPSSFTGEDVLEVLVPGRPHLVERIIDAWTARAGCRRARPGEFSARAFLAGKMSLEEAEGVAAIIAAEHDEELEAAADLRQGRTGRRHAALASELAGLLALVEAGIDFTDQEDVVAIGSGELRARLDAALDVIRELGVAPGDAATRLTTPRVAIVGAPNAGKSTLFNTLLGRERSIVSDVAGTTRDVIEEPLSLDAVRPGTGSATLVDLAGLDDALAQARGELERAAQGAAASAIAQADVVLWCDPTARFDASSLPPAAAAALSRLGTRQVLRVRTCADLVAQGASESLSVCALDGFGLARLLRAVADVAVAGRGRRGLAAILPRHRAALERCAVATRLARDLAAATADDARLDRPEEVAQALRDALDAAGELSGRIGVEEILGRVFASFCVGK